jgi:hypothetical protein
VVGASHTRAAAAVGTAATICADARARFGVVRAALDQLKALVPAERYYKYVPPTCACG